MYKASREEIDSLEAELDFIDFGNLPDYLAVVASAIDQCGPKGKDSKVTAQVLNVVGEAGEFAEAYRRYRGGARRPGDKEEVAMELADVLISAMIMCERLNLDVESIIGAKLRKIVTRGWNDHEVPA